MDYRKKTFSLIQSPSNPLIHYEFESYIVKIIFLTKFMNNAT